MTDGGWAFASDGKRWHFFPADETGTPALCERYTYHGALGRLRPLDQIGTVGRLCAVCRDEWQRQQRRRSA